MNITLYQRTYPVTGAPVSLSLVPFAVSQVYTYLAGGEVYEACYSEVRIDAPDDARVELLKNRVTWDGGRGRVHSTAKEVFDFAHAGTSGFQLPR